MRKSFLSILSGGLALCLCACSPAAPASKREHVSQLAGPERDPASLPSAEMKTGWYYAHLSPRDQAIYHRLWNGIQAGQNDIAMNGENIDRMHHVLEILLLEQPQFFHLSVVYDYTSAEGDSNRVLAFHPHYALSQEQYAEMLGEVEEKAEEMLTEAKTWSNWDYELELEIHDQLVRNITYFTDPKVEKEDRFNSFQTLYGALVEGKANCMGYIDAMTYLMNQLDIPCIGVSAPAQNSSGVTEGHSWNMAEIEGQWYHVDVCWNDTGLESESNPEAVMHTYFNVSDDKLAKYRDLETAQVNTTVLPEASSEAADYYQRNRLVMESPEQLQEKLSEAFPELTEGQPFEVRLGWDGTFSQRQELIRNCLQEAARVHAYDPEYEYTISLDEPMDTLYLEVHPLS